MADQRPPAGETGKGGPADQPPEAEGKKKKTFGPDPLKLLSATGEDGAATIPLRNKPAWATRKAAMDTFGAVSKDRSFGRFELLMEVSHGGMATLYLARLRGPEAFEKILAIKKIHDHLAREPTFVAMFLDEARLAARIQHPNVVTIFDLGAFEDSYFIAMEYVHGQNLREVLRESARRKELIPWETSVRMAAEALKGLHAAHQLRNDQGEPLNVVHRDVSPQNILLSYEGNVKVVDFGVAYAAEKIAHTDDGTIKGKVSYMSPEHADGEPTDRRSDIFSLGIVLFESVCFQRLFRRGNQSATLKAVLGADVPRPRSIRPEIPPDLERAIMKALARKPEDRFGTALEMAECLEELLVTHGKVVTQGTLSKLVSNLFCDRKKQKDIQIKQALASPSPVVMKSTSKDWGTGSSVDVSGAVSTKPRAAGRWNRFLAAAAIVLVALVGVGVGVYVVRKSGDEPGRKTHKAASDETHSDNATRPASSPKGDAVAPRPAAKPATVTVKVTVLPKQAQVTVIFRGKAHKGSEFETVVPRSDKAETLEIRAPNYEKRTLVVVPVRDNKLTLTLKRIPAGKTRPVRPVRRGEPLHRFLKELPR